MKPKVQLSKVEWVQPPDFFILFLRMDLGLSDKSLELNEFCCLKATAKSPYAVFSSSLLFVSISSASLQTASFIFDISFTCYIKRNLFQLASFCNRFGA